MRWPWTRPPAASPSPSPSPEPPVAVTERPLPVKPQRPQGEWRAVGPLQTAADAPSLGTSTAFLASLATRQSPPPMLQRLSHNRGADAPAGIAVGVARGIAPVTSAAFAAPGVRGQTVLRKPPAAAVQRQAGLGYWLAQSPTPETATPQPGTPDEPAPAATAAAPEAISAAPRFAARESLASLPSADLRNETPMPAGVAAGPGEELTQLPLAVGTEPPGVMSVTGGTGGDFLPGAEPAVAVQRSSESLQQPALSPPLGGPGLPGPVAGKLTRADRPTNRALPVVTGPAAAPLVSRLELPLPRRVSTPPSVAGQVASTAGMPVGSTSAGSAPVLPSATTRDQPGPAEPGSAGSADTPSTIAPLFGSRPATSLLASSPPSGDPEVGPLPGVTPPAGSPTTGSPTSRSQPVGMHAPPTPPSAPLPSVSRTVAAASGSDLGSAEPAGAQTTAAPLSKTTANTDFSKNPAAISFDASDLTGVSGTRPVQRAHPPRGLGEPLPGVPRRLRGDDALRATSTSPSPLPPPRVPDTTATRVEPPFPAVPREEIESLTRESVLPTLRAVGAGPEPTSMVRAPSVQRAAGPAEPRQVPLVGDAPVQEMLTTQRSGWAPPAEQPPSESEPEAGSTPQTETPPGTTPPTVWLRPEPTDSLPTVATRQNLPPVAVGRDHAPVAQRTARGAETVAALPSTPTGGDLPTTAAPGTPAAGTTATLPPRIQRVEAPAFVPMMDDLVHSPIRQLAVTEAVNGPIVQRAAAPAVEEIQTAQSAAAAPAAGAGNPAELADQLYEHIAGRLRRDLLIERERSCLLLDR